MRWPIQGSQGIVRVQGAGGTTLPAIAFIAVAAVALLTIPGKGRK